MAIEDEAGQVAAQALEQAQKTQEAMSVTAIEMASKSQRVAFLVFAFASQMTGVDEAIISPDLRHELIMRAADAGWHAELCGHGGE